MIASFIHYSASKNDEYYTEDIDIFAAKEADEDQAEKK